MDDRSRDALDIWHGSRGLILAIVLCGAAVLIVFLVSLGGV